MCRRLLLWLILLLIPGVVFAAKWLYVPTPVDVWAVCDTTQRCSHAEDWVYDTDVWEEIADTTADGSAYLTMKSGTRDYQSQIASEIDTTCDYLWVRARGSGYLWIDDAPFRYVPSNTKANILFNGATATDWTWTRVGNRSDENLQRVEEGNTTPVNDTAQKDFNFTSGDDIYVLATPQVHLDSWFCSTDANATPVSPGGGEGTTISYSLFEAPVEPPNADDAQWDRASVVAKSGYTSTPTADMVIKAMWVSGTPDRVCVWGEEDLANQFWTTRSADDTGIGSEQSLIAYFRMANLDRLKDTNAWLLGVSPQPQFYDATWPSGTFSTTADLANMTLNATVSTNRRRIQACFDAPSALSTGTQWLCDFRQQERVTGGALKVKQAFSSSSSVDVALWGVCEAGVALPAAPADNTPPSVGSVAFSNVTATSFTVTATASDAQSGISACHVVYDTTNDNSVTFGTDPSVQGTMSGGSCSATVTGLTAATAYEAAVYATNGVGLSTTGAVGDQTTLAAGGTFYVSVGGSGSTCSNGSPCAITKLASKTTGEFPNPGETWIVKNGTYNMASIGTVAINCASNGGNALNGNASAPITVQAENERQAWLKSNGLQSALRLSNCNYWRVNGLRFSSQDNNATGEGSSLVEIRSSHNLRFYRNLFHHSNRYGNMSLLQNGDTAATASNNNEFVENEFYYFHRYPLISKYGSGTIERLNYYNSRGYMDITGGFPSAAIALDQGDACGRSYPGSNHLVESNIAEKCGWGFAPEPSVNAVNNRYFGNIHLNGPMGSGVIGKPNEQMSFDYYHKDLLMVNPSTYGFYIRSGRNTRCEQCTVFGGDRGFTYASSLSDPGKAPRSMFLQNVLSVTPTVWGFYTDQVNLEAWGVNYMAVLNASSGTFTPAASHDNIDNEVINASNQMGNCRVWVPTSATLLKGTGLNGNDIGAEVLYLYRNGIKDTSTKLWNSSTGKWLGSNGAVISGTNPTFNATTPVTSADINTTTNSPQDVHTRLNILSSNCLPVGY